MASKEGFAFGLTLVGSNRQNVRGKAFRSSHGVVDVGAVYSTVLGSVKSTSVLQEANDATLKNQSQDHLLKNLVLALVLLILNLDLREINKMVDFAPFRIPLHRRWQTLAVSHFIFDFLAFALTSLIVCTYLFFFTSYWYIVVLYLIYLYIDRNTPETGGRRSTWLRNWKLWQHMANYFPVTLHKTVDLDPKRNYIFGVHPHGVLCIGSFTNFCCNGSGFDSIFRGFKSYLTMLPLWFWIPVYRDYLMGGGLIPSTKKSIQSIITRPGGGNICCIIPGGAPESLNARPGNVVIFVKERRGFVKMAMVHGVPLVPVFSFGDHELWEQDEYPPGSFMKSFQEESMKWLTFALPAFHARGIFQYNYGLMPYRRCVNTVVGEPIEVEKNPNPTREEVAALHEHYIAKLQELFHKHKNKYARKDCKLIIH